MEANANQETEAHGGQVEDALRHHEASGEKEIGRRDEWHGIQQESLCVTNIKKSVKKLTRIYEIQVHFGGIN